MLPGIIACGSYCLAQNADIYISKEFKSRYMQNPSYMMSSFIRATQKEGLVYANNEGPDQTARMRSLIRAFDVRQA